MNDPGSTNHMSRINNIHQTSSDLKAIAVKFDMKFKRAMLHAIKCGEEKAILGVVRPFTMMQLRSFAYPHSLGGSVASSCADSC